MTYAFAHVKRISLVGNGPVARATAGEIDRADLVVRINRGDLCGVAGRRTDLLILRDPDQIARSIAKGDPMNPLAQRGAGRLLFLAPPQEPKDRALVDWLAGGKPVEYLSPDLRPRLNERLARFEGVKDPKPSTGACALWYLLEQFPAARINLYGFSHAGWEGHAWDAERTWVDELAAQGRVSRAPIEGKLARLGVVAQCRRQFVRALRHVRDMRA